VVEVRIVITLLFYIVVLRLLVGVVNF
jgi:hypothetical protein